MSVTQAALAIVGAIIGSSLVTILAFMLILRYRRLKRRQSRIAASSRNNISYPALSKTSNAGYGPNTYENQFGGPRVVDANGFPVEIKQPPRAAGMGQERVDSMSSYGSGSELMGLGFATSNYGQEAKNPASQDKNFTLKDAPKGKFSLFPQAKDDPQPSASTAVGSSPKSQTRGSKIFPPSLDTWLRAGTSVSPFGTLQKGPKK